MEEPLSERHRVHPKETRKSKKDPPLVMPVIIVAFVLAMVIGLVVRGKAPRGTCVFDHVYRKSMCRTKQLRSIPPDISDSVLTLHIGHHLDKTENYFTVLEKSNFTRFNFMQDLGLVKCGIEEIKPGAFSALVSLKNLNLRYNRIQNIEPGTFSGIRHLETLLLSNNPILILEDNIFDGMQIDYLFFDNNPALVEISPQTFEGAIIKSLSFNRTNLRTIPDNAITQLGRNLVNFTLKNNLQNLALPDLIFQGLKLQILSLSNSRLRSVDFLEKTSAENVDLNDNPLEEFDIDNTSGNIKILSLARTGLSRVTDDDISLFQSLEILNLAGNDITVVNATTFLEMKELRVLDLSSNDIYDFDGDFTDGFFNLERLHLHDNDIQTLPSIIEPLFSRLQNLSLRGNPLHCNCELRWLAKWIEDHRFILQEVDAVRCETPEPTNFTQISDYGFLCQPPTIFNASFDEDGISLICIAGGDPAPRVTWLPPSPGEATVSLPLRSEKKTFRTKSSLTVTKDGNYTCIADNIAGDDRIEVNTRKMPSAGVKFVVESKEIEILETPQGFFITLGLITLLAYFIRRDSLKDLEKE